MSDDIQPGVWMNAKTDRRWIEQKQWILLEIERSFRRFHATSCPKCDMRSYRPSDVTRWMVIPL